MLYTYDIYILSVPCCVKPILRINYRINTRIRFITTRMTQGATQVIWIRRRVSIYFTHGCPPFFLLRQL